MTYLILILSFPLMLIFPSSFHRPAKKAISKGIVWYTMADAQQLAQQNGKKVLVYSKASWCEYCKKMESKVYTDPAVQHLLSEYFYPVKVDIESSDNLKFNNHPMTQEAFAREMGVRGTPTFLFVDEKGNVLGMQPGYIPAKTFKKLLVYIGSNAYKKTNFQDYHLPKGK